MTIEVDLVSKLEEYGLPVALGHADDDTGTSFIYAKRSNQVIDLLLNGDYGLITTTFDVECISLDLNEAQAIAQSIKSDLHGYTGVLGNSNVECIEVMDHSDDYEPQGFGNNNQGFFYASLSLEILHLDL